MHLNLVFESYTHPWFGGAHLQLMRASDGRLLSVSTLVLIAVQQKGILTNTYSSVRLEQIPHYITSDFNFPKSKVPKPVTYAPHAGISTTVLIRNNVVDTHRIPTSSRGESVGPTTRVVPSL